MSGALVYGQQVAPVSRSAPAATTTPRAPATATADSSADTVSPTQAWAPNLPDAFSILVESTQAAPAGAWGSASRRGLFPLSAMGRLEHFCSTPASYPLQIRFYVDSMVTPRPQPFRPPSLSVSATFTPAGGSPRAIANVADSAPRYDGPGSPLAPVFGELFAASSSASGALTVAARLDDPDTSAGVSYRDAVGCELVPCA